METDGPPVPLASRALAGVVPGSPLLQPFAQRLVLGAYYRTVASRPFRALEDGSLTPRKTSFRPPDTAARGS